MPSGIKEIGHVPYILRFLETVADDNQILVYQAFVLKALDKVKVVCGRGLDMDIVFQHFFKDELELGTLRTVAIMIFTIITYFRHSIAEHTLRTLNLTGDFRKISQFQGSTVLLYDIHHVDVIDNQGTVFNPEFILRKIECLADQVDILILHPLRNC